MNYKDTVNLINSVFKKYGIKSDYNNKICGYIIRTQRVLAYLLFNLTENNDIQLDFDIIQGNECDLAFYREIRDTIKPNRKRKISEIY